MNNKMNINKHFDFNIIKNYDELKLNFDMMNFLVKIPNNKKYGKIERKGDLFYGIKNNELYDMKITLYYESHYNLIIESSIVKSGDIYMMKIPLIMIKLYKYNKFYYKIERNNPKFYNVIFDTYNTEFIYGYVLKSLRKNIVDIDLFYVNKNISLFYTNGSVYDWMYMIYNTNNKYNNDIYLEFKKNNDMWFELLE